LFGRHGMVWRVAKPVWAYTRQDFHPMQVGSATLSKDWLESHADQWRAVGSATHNAA
jgi:predicted metal-dependent hydrolase